MKWVNRILFCISTLFLFAGMMLTVWGVFFISFAILVECGWDEANAYFWEKFDSF